MYGAYYSVKAGDVWRTVSAAAAVMVAILWNNRERAGTGTCWPTRLIQVVSLAGVCAKHFYARDDPSLPLSLESMGMISKTY